jgi:dinuclear metal center YbgI/SA1388 family protein
MVTVAEIAAVLEGWAPPATAESYDNVGLLVGDRGAEVRSILVALDLTPEVVSEAVAGGFDLIITHHPLIFGPLKALVSGPFVSGMALRLARAGIALYAAHTNLDAARDGVSFELARRIGLRDLDFLERASETVMKLVTFVPPSHADQVRLALGKAGAGVIGGYRDCAFATPGTGHFRPGPNTDPFIGSRGGDAQEVQEIRLEIEVSRWLVERVLAALRDAHPYEQPAFDLYPVAQRATNIGFGAVGLLPAPLSRSDFLEHVRAALAVSVLRWSGPEKLEVSRVAVCGGSGSRFLRSAARQSCQALITADVSYHHFFDVFDDNGRAEVLLIDAGHYETEAATEDLIVRRLSSDFPDLRWQKTGATTNPVRYYHGRLS